jgi:hypothetical protein
MEDKLSQLLEKPCCIQRDVPEIVAAFEVPRRDIEDTPNKIPISFYDTRSSPSSIHPRRLESGDAKLAFPVDRLLLAHGVFPKPACTGEGWA